MKAYSLIVCIALGYSAAVPADDIAEISDTIHRLATGVDQQDDKTLLSVFRADAALFATNPTGDDLVVVSADKFAELHAQKRFGGQVRHVEIEYVDITDDLVAMAKVLATNERVHYTYYLGFTKVDGTWLVQTFLQRSRKADQDTAKE